MPAPLPKIRSILFLGFLLALAAGSAAVLFASGFPGRDFVRVEKVEPTGNAENPTSITITFSAPMAAETEVGKTQSLADAPFILTPPVSALGVWRTPRTYVVMPTSPFSLATEYCIEMKEGIRDTAGQPLKNAYVFRTALPRLLDATTRYEKNRTIINLEFNMPIAPQVLKKLLSAKDGKGQALTPSLTGATPATHLSVILPPLPDRAFTLAIAPGLVSSAGPLPNKKQFTIQGNRIRQDQASAEPLKVGAIYSDRDRNGLRIMVRFSESAGENPPATDFREYVTVEPQVGNLTILPRYSQWYDTLEIRGDFKPHETVTVTVKKGFTINGDNTLAQDATGTVTMPDYQARLAFSEAGSYLTPDRSTLVAIDALNLKEAGYSLLKLYENNVTVAMVSNQQDLDIPANLSQVVREGTVRLDTPLNEVQRRSINIEKMAAGNRGVFQLQLNAKPLPEGGDDEWSLRNIRKTIILSDIGICAGIRENGVLVWANSISRGTPVSGASVRVFSPSNQVIAQGTTDASGVFTLDRDEPWEKGLAPCLVTVSADGDMSFLQLTRDLQSRGGCDTSGRPYLKTGYEAFLFAPRGVFRPGEKVEIKALVRASDFAAPRGVPLQWRVTAPANRELRRDALVLDERGAGLFSFVLPESAPTGYYRAGLFVPGTENPIGTVDFAVEEFVPPRLEVGIDAQVAGKAGILTPKGKIAYAIDASYLFGAPAAGMTYTGDFTVVPKRFAPAGWENFLFEDETRPFAPIRERNAASGRLDEKGDARTEFTAEAWKAPSILSIVFTARVQDDGGRWTSRTHATDWYPAETMIGLQRDDVQARAGSPLRMTAAAVTPDGTPGTPGELRAELFRVNTHYTWIERDGRSWYETDEEYLPVSSQTLSTPLKEGMTQFDMIPPAGGDYLVRVSDTRSGAAASRRFYASSQNGEGARTGSALMDRVFLELDKPHYRPGETATLTVRAPFTGEALLTAQTDRGLWTKAVTLAETESTLSIPVTADMGPNAYLILWLVRPVTSTEEGGAAWSAHRALGIASLSLSPLPKGLNVSLEAPEKALPGKPVSVAVALRDEKGNPIAGEVALALVDEGILSLTGYATPDPLGFFLGRRALAMKLFDMYDLLLPPELVALPLLGPGGGSPGAGMEAFMSNLRRNQEVLSVFLGKIATDADGRATALITLPEYAGKGRLMAVAVSDDRMGSASASVIISRNVVVEATAPRALAPGDAFELPVSVFFSDPAKAAEAEVHIHAAGPLALSGDAAFTARADGQNGAAPVKKTFSMRALEGNAIATITIETAVPGSPDDSYTQKIEVPVRTPYPRTSVSGSGKIPANGSVAVTVPGGWLPDTEQGFLSISGGPTADLMPLLIQLARYPYGCLEQTVSRAFPYAILPEDASRAATLSLGSETARQLLEGAIFRLGTMQNPDGSFRMWPDQDWSPYAWGSVYATHFLLQAQKKAPVPESMLNQGLEWLRALLAQPVLPGPRGADAASQYATKAYAAFVLTLAGRPPVAWLGYLTENENAMLPSGRIFLAAAKALHSGSPEPLRALPSMETASPAAGPTLESPLRNEALLLLVWSMIDPTSGEAQDLAQAVGKAMREHPAWHSTQENALICMGLGEYMRATEASHQPFAAVAVTRTGGLVAQGDNAAPVAVASATLSGDSPLSLASQGPGTPLFSWTVSGVPTAPPKPVASNLAIRRVFAAPDGAPLPVDKDGCLRLRQGEVMNITLTLSPGSQPLRDAVLTDILAGGVEVENPRLTGGPDDKEKEPSSRRIDIRDDRLILFFENVSSPVQYTYSVRAVTKGRFLLPPAAAEGMYDPMRHALTDAGVLIIE